MTAQDVINGTSWDMRQVLNASTQATQMLTWVDRVHKDVLHSSVYTMLNMAIASVATVVGTSTYTLPALRRVVNVYDTTTNRLLLPIATLSMPVTASGAAYPTAQMPGTSPIMVNMQRELHRKSQTPLPQYWFINGTSLQIFPAPVYAVTLQVNYEQAVVTLALPTTTLVPPDDAIDMMIAGTNMYAAQFLKRGSEAEFWAKLYETLKHQPAVI